MSNHKGHLLGGCIAYGITLLGVIITSCFIRSVSFDLLKQQAVLHHTPSFLADAEYTIHHYFPLIISGITWLLSRCWPLILISFEWLLFTLAGAMFPDIDIKSTSQKYWYSFIFVCLLVFIGRKNFYTVAFISVTSMLPLFSNHRGLFHRTWFVVLLPLTTWYCISQGCPSMRTLLFYDTLFFITGALSHLWLDKGTKMFRF